MVADGGAAGRFAVSIRVNLSVDCGLGAALASGTYLYFINFKCDLSVLR